MGTAGRPGVEAAAAEVHQAVQAGIRAGERADQVILLGDAAVKAWRGLPTHMGKLGDLARLRTRLADLLAADPTPDPMTRVRDCAAAFTDTGSPWSVKQEGEWDRWLRLTTSAGKPLHLMTVAETRANARATREPLVSIVPDEPEGPSRVDDLEQEARRFSPRDAGF